MSLTGNEHFTFDGMPIGLLLQDFWSWQSSSLLNNTLRGVMAEYIVGNALGVLDSHRKIWNLHDLTYNGTRIEVKTSCCVQEWEQERPSPLIFSIESKQNNDLYVFCAHTEANPMILDQWLFFPVLTSELVEELGEQKTARVSTIRRFCDGYKYDSLRDAVDFTLSGDTEAADRIASRKALRQYG